MELPNELVDRIANYLAMQSYREVAGLLADISKAVKAEQGAPGLPDKDDGKES